MPTRPPSLELRRDRGRCPRDNSCGRKPAAPGLVSIPPAAQTVPTAPADLGAAGHAFWEHLWSMCGRVSAADDWKYVAECARLVDDLELAQCLYRRTRDFRDGRVAVALTHAVAETLDGLGFDPEARAKLGVADRPY